MKKALALILAALLLLSCTAALADWECVLCHLTNTDEVTICRDCGKAEPLHDPQVAMTGINFIKLKWRGHCAAFDLYIRETGSSWRWVDSTEKNSFQFIDLKEGTAYEIMISDGDEQNITIAAATDGDALSVPQGAAPVSNPVPPSDEAKETEQKKDIQVGDIITFGHYPQTAEGTDNTPIEWQVLEVKDGNALVISKYGLDAHRYHGPY